MVTGIMIYEDVNCDVLIETMKAETATTIDKAFKTIIDNNDGALIQLTYVNNDTCTIINLEGFSA